MLNVQAVPAFDDNYIWLIRRGDQPQVAIVDPGDAEPVIAAINAQGLQPVAILITHHHWDHVGGISDLLAQYPSLPVFGPARETIPHITQPLGEGDSVEIIKEKVGDWSIEEGQYRFDIEGRTVYALWGTGSPPAEITGEVRVIEISGAEKVTDSASLELITR